MAAVLLCHQDCSEIPHPEMEDKNVEHSLLQCSQHFTFDRYGRSSDWCGRFTKSRPFNHLACGSAQTILGTHLVLSLISHSGIHNEKGDL